MEQMRKGGLYRNTATFYHVPTPVNPTHYSFLYAESLFLYLGDDISLDNQVIEPTTGAWKTEHWHFWKILLDEKPVWLLANGPDGHAFLLSHVVEVTHNNLDASGKALQDDTNVL